MTLHDQFRQWFYAHEIRVVILSQLAAALAGTLAGVWCSRTRMFGWVAIVLLMLSGAAAFADTFEPPNLTTGLIVSWTFYFVAPLGVIYSFYARRRAQDRASICSASVSEAPSASLYEAVSYARISRCKGADVGSGFTHHVGALAVARFVGLPGMNLSGCLYM